MQTINIDKSKTVAFTGHHRYFRDDIADKAISNIILFYRYYKGCFLHRNDYMIANCSLLITCYGQISHNRTGYIVHRTEANNIPIINLCK